MLCSKKNEWFKKIKDDTSSEETMWKHNKSYCALLLRTEKFP